MRTWKTPCRMVLVRAAGRSVARVSAVEVDRAAPARLGRTGPPAKLREGEPAIERRVRSRRRRPAKPPSALDEADALAVEPNAERAEPRRGADRFIGDRRPDALDMPRGRSATGPGADEGGW